MADTPKHSVSVAGVVVDEQGRVLVIKRRDNGHWEPPGGVLELNETFESGVRREILEETGVRVRVDGLSGAYKNMRRGIVSLVFRCTPEQQDLGECDSEAQLIKWLPMAEALALMDPAYAVRLSDALLQHVPTRSHDGIELI